MEFTVKASCVYGGRDVEHSNHHVASENGDHVTDQQTATSLNLLVLSVLSDDIYRFMNYCNLFASPMSLTCRMNAVGNLSALASL